MVIRLLTYNEIDFTQWDACIANARHSMIYAHRFYLDGMAPKWSALVMNEYEAVMPLPFNKKWGITYLYQPPFTQQLGIFGQQSVTSEIADGFVTAIKQQYRFAEIFVNFNTGDEQPNFVLPLAQPYELIRKGYKNDLLKNLKHAEKFSLVYSPGNDAAEAIGLYIKQYATKTPHVKEVHYERFRQVCEVASKNNQLLTRSVYDTAGQLLAVALLLKDNHRLYNVMSTVTPQGRHCEANHFLFDQLISEFAGNLQSLDFEGSAIPGIADFYKKFGAINEPYYFLRFNRLPWLLRRFK